MSERRFTRPTTDPIHMEGEADAYPGEAFANVKIGNLVICDDGVLPAAGIASDMAWFGVS